MSGEEAREWVEVQKGKRRKRGLRVMAGAAKALEALKERVIEWTCV